MNMLQDYDTMKIIVQKYGGSSLSDTDKVKQIAGKIITQVEKGKKLVVVVSAMGKTTDNLIKLSKEITDTPTPRELDMLLTTGEQVSASLLAMALNENNVKAISLNAFQAGIFTTGDFNIARIKNLNTRKILSLLEDHEVIVITGFQGITEHGEITTLGRGGSDTSAVALASALRVNCELYSDFPGIFTIDPRLYHKAKKLDKITYDEMLEVASLGAKVLHSRSVEIAKKFATVMYCGASFSETKGTFIVEKNIEQPMVSSLSVMDNQAHVTISHLPEDYTVIHNIFDYIAKEDLNVDMISVINMESSITLSFSIIEDEKHDVQITLDPILSKYENCKVEFEHGFMKTSIVGVGMRTARGVASRFFGALSHIPIKMVTTSEIKISALLEEKYKDEVIALLAEEFSL